MRSKIAQKILDNTPQATKDKVSSYAKMLLSDVIKSVCINCGKPKEEHSKATELCPTRFAHFEQAVL